MLGQLSGNHQCGKKSNCYSAAQLVTPVWRKVEVFQELRWRTRLITGTNPNLSSQTFISLPLILLSYLCLLRVVSGNQYVKLGAKHRSLQHGRQGRGSEKESEVLHVGWSAMPLQLWGSSFVGSQEELVLSSCSPVS